jgi:DNA-binding MarR family transcriptional regulator
MMNRHKTPQISQSDYQALAEIRFHIRRFQHFSEQAARAAGIVPQQHQLLLTLKGLPAGRKATIGELADRLLIKHHSMVELIDRLAERKLIQRLRDESDQRRVLIQLTLQGEQVLQKLALQHLNELQLEGPALLRALRTLITDHADT